MNLRDIAKRIVAPEFLLFFVAVWDQPIDSSISTVNSTSSCCAVHAPLCATARQFVCAYTSDVLRSKNVYAKVCIGSSRSLSPWPRLAVARRIPSLRRALPLATHGSFLVPLTFFCQTTVLKDPASFWGSFACLVVRSTVSANFLAEPVNCDNKRAPCEKSTSSISVSR